MFLLDKHFDWPIVQVGNESVTDWGQKTTLGRLPGSLFPGSLAPWLALSLSINFQLEMKNDSICNRLHFYLAVLLLLTSTSLPCPGYLLLSL